MLAQHLANKNDWQTPAVWCERVREVLGNIDLDPASSSAANAVVGADRIYTEKENGLIQTWTGRVFLNPPGGRGVPQKFFEKLCLHYRKYEVESAIYLGYSLEQLLWVQTMPEYFEVAVPRRRIRFTGAGESPTHGNFFLLLSTDADTRYRFRHVFDLANCLLLDRQYR